MAKTCGNPGQAERGKESYVPVPSELVEDILRYPAGIDEDRIFFHNRGDKAGRPRLEGSFDNLLVRARIRNFRFHDLRHAFTS